MVFATAMYPAEGWRSCADGDPLSFSKLGDRIGLATRFNGDYEVIYHGRIRLKTRSEGCCGVV